MDNKSIICDFENLYKTKFSKGRKSVLKKTEKLSFKKIFLDTETEQFILNHFKGLKNKCQIQDFVQFVKQYEDHLKMVGVYHSESLISLGIFTEIKDRFGLLALVNNEKFISYNGASFMISEFLKKEISNKSFDFFPYFL